MATVLPKGVAVVGAPRRGAQGGGSKRPPSYADLERAGLLAPLSAPWTHFDDHEREIAAWLARHGVSVRSVERAAWPTPDAVIDAAGVTVEFKRLMPHAANPVGALQQRIRDGRRQSPHVVIDVRGTTLTRNDVNRALLYALRTGGLDLSEVVVIGPEFVVSWHEDGGPYVEG